MSEKLLAADAVKAIQDSVRTEVIAVDEVDYTTRPVYAPPVEDAAETLMVHTLTGLIDYLAGNIDKHAPDSVAIHIVSPSQVNLVGVLAGRPKRRDVLLSAEANPCAFRFGSFETCEQFNIDLQSLFTDVADRPNVLKVVGNIKEEVVGQFDDDGVTQTVTARAGVARVSEIPVPNPVSLAPYRTFAEVEQPVSPFVLRMKKGMAEGTTPTCALFEADGGAWKLVAIDNVAKYLRIKVGELKGGMDTIAIIA